MDSAIIGAIIGGLCAIIAAVIPLLLKRKKKPPQLLPKPPLPPEIPSKPPLPTEIPSPPTPYFAHPYPLQENFTGRLPEREMLTDWLTRDPHPMLTMTGIGGMGKSALCWYWLQEDIRGSEEQPKKVMWWSFYDKESRFERFLLKAIEYFSDEEIDWRELKSPRDQMDRLYNEILYQNRFLLILDGVERVLRGYAGLGSPYQGDEVREDERGDFRACIDPNLGIFLQQLASGYPKTKTLLTSRLYPRELDDIAGCLHKELTQMDKEDAVEFFHRQGVEGTRAEIEAACEPFGYHPLSLRLLSGMIIKDPKYMGDIVAWSRHNPLPELKGIRGEHHILELAYDSLDTQKQSLISKLAVFRNPMDYEAIAIFNEFKTEEEFDNALIELVDRGLLLRNTQTNSYDLHPIVRRYCYDRLKDKEGVHSRLRDYFETIPEPEKIESLDDLAPVIELYHHTVGSGRYEEACDLFMNALISQLIINLVPTT
ncbi:MAG: hypothetical protein AB1630_05475 [bacterium]